MNKIYREMWKAIMYDPCAGGYGQDPYYDNPRPHASLAWRLGALKRVALVEYSDSDEESEGEDVVELNVASVTLTAGDRKELVKLEGSGSS